MEAGIPLTCEAMLLTGAVEGYEKRQIYITQSLFVWGQTEDGITVGSCPPLAVGVKSV